MIKISFLIKSSKRRFSSELGDMFPIYRYQKNYLKDMGFDVRVYRDAYKFVTAGLPRGNFWYRSGVRSGVLFDRFRIMNYSERALEKRQECISKWTKAAREYAMGMYA